MINLIYNTENNEKNAIIKIESESINSMDAMQFNDVINTLDKDIHLVTIDIDCVTYISSPGIGMFLNAHIILKRNNIKFKIINTSESIKKLFVMTRIDYAISVEYKENN
jgi:anti-anti-sigma factor